MTNYDCPTCKESVFVRVGRIVLDSNGLADEFEEIGFRCEKCRTMVTVNESKTISVVRTGTEAQPGEMQSKHRFISSVSAADRGFGRGREPF